MMPISVAGPIGTNVNLEEGFGELHWQRSTLPESRPALLHSRIELLATFPPSNFPYHSILSSNTTSFRFVPVPSRIFPPLIHPHSRFPPNLPPNLPPLVPLLHSVTTRQNLAHNSQNFDLFLITKSQIALLNHTIQQSQFLWAEVQDHE